MPTAFINVTFHELCECAYLTWGTIPGGVNTRTFITLMSQWNTVPLVCPAPQKHLTEQWPLPWHLNYSGLLCTVQDAFVMDFPENYERVNTV